MRYAFALAACLLLPATGPAVMSGTMNGLLAIAVFGLMPAAAHAAEVTAVSKIGSVTVFPSGAEVSRTAKVKLDKGEHTLIIQDLAAEEAPAVDRTDFQFAVGLALEADGARHRFGG